MHGENTKEKKIYLHFDAEGVLVGNQHSDDKELNNYYLEAIKTLKKEGYDVTADLCTIANVPHANNKLTEVTEKDSLQIISQDRQDKGLPIMLKGKGITSESEGEEFLGKLFVYNNNKLELQIDKTKYPKLHKVFANDNSFGYRSGDPINHATLHQNYDKAKLSLMMMLYRKEVLLEDVSGSTFYFVDNDEKHLQKFTPEVKEAFKELGVTAKTIGVDNYINRQGETQDAKAGGKGDLSNIQNDKDFGRRILNDVQNNVSLEVITESNHYTITFPKNGKDHVKLSTEIDFDKEERLNSERRTQHATILEVLREEFGTSGEWRCKPEANVRKTDDKDGNKYSLHNHALFSDKTHDVIMNHNTSHGAIAIINEEDNWLSNLSEKQIRNINTKLESSGMIFIAEGYPGKDTEKVGRRFVIKENQVRYLRSESSELNNGCSY